jgi:group I intron endonuclease
MKIENLEVYGVIYKIRNKINNKLYFGQTIQKGGFDTRYENDLEKYTHNEHLKRSIQKYGIKNFEIDKEFDIGYSQEELDKLEDMYIKIYDTINPNFGYNRRYGGSKGKLTQETKLKISKSHKGVKLSKEHILHMKENHADFSGENHPFYGKRHTEKSKEQISKNRKGKNIGESNPSYGIPKSIETRRKISKALSGENHPNYGKHRSQQTKEKIGVAHKGMKHSNETKKLISQKTKGRNIGVDNVTSRKIVCLNTEEIFYGQGEIKRKYEFISENHITSCCRNKRKYCGTLNGINLAWAYYDDYILMTNEEIKNKIIVANKNMVICITVQKIFTTAMEGSKYYNFGNSSGISNCCKGVGKSAGKHPETGEPLVWRYISSLTESEYIFYDIENKLKELENSQLNNTEQSQELSQTQEDDFFYCTIFN